jgi:hypothetical protein
MALGPLLKDAARAVIQEGSSPLKQAHETVERINNP